MILAQHQETVIAILGLILGASFLIVLGVVVLVLYRAFERRALRSLQARYADLEVHDVAQPGDVTIAYHTYHGLIAWFTQTTHRVSLPPDQARELLRRLLRYNLLWGLFSAGAVFIPPIAVVNYFTQRRSIADQEAAYDVAMAASRTKSTGSLLLPASADNPYASPRTPITSNVHSRSLFRQAIGWTCAGLCVVFIVGTVTGLIAKQFEGAAGCALISGLLGWTAWDWIRRPSVE